MVDKIRVVITAWLRGEKFLVYRGCRKEDPKKNMDISSRNCVSRCMVAWKMEEKTPMKTSETAMVSMPKMAPRSPGRLGDLQA